MSWSGGYEMSKVFGPDVQFGMTTYGLLGSMDAQWCVADTTHQEGSPRMRPTVSGDKGIAEAAQQKIVGTTQAATRREQVEKPA